MVVSKGEGETSIKKLDKPILWFLDCEKVGGILTDIFPLVITNAMSNYDVSWILLEGGIPCDIMFTELFENLGQKKEKL